MSAKAFSNDSHLHPNLSSIIPTYPGIAYCLLIIPESFIFTTYSIISIVLLLPLCIFILHLGLQRWRQQRSTFAAATTSHLDSFTYHVVAMELIGLLGHTLCLCGISKYDVDMVNVGFYLYCFSWFGEIFFQILTCVEHYLAAVHPITYLSLRRERGIRIRNITIGFVWLLCCGGTILLTLEELVTFGLVVFALIVISFCSLSVLCVLIRPKPGEQGGDKEKVVQSKRRAFYIILAILGLLLLKCFWSLIWLVLDSMKIHTCVSMTCGCWFNLPSTLLLPLLFLHRAGSLVCCKNNTK